MVERSSDPCFLGLYHAGGLLHHVGFSSAIKAKDKLALTDKLAAIATDRSLVEVSYDFTGGRFRHGTSILRWRPDKKPRQRTFEQLQQKIDQRLLAGHHLKQIVFRLGAGVVFHHCGGVRHQARPYIPAILSGLRHPFGRA